VLPADWRGYRSQIKNVLCGGVIEIGCERKCIDAYDSFIEAHDLAVSRDIRRPFKCVQGSTLNDLK